jgi:FAD/FMN-containing dehydrogenase
MDVALARAERKHCARDQIGGGARADADPQPAYGSAAEIVTGMEVALAAGTLLRTGQGALSVSSKPFLRTFGPDLTGLFTHDGGMFGIKTEASFRLIETPSSTGFASFAFAALADAAAALSAIARADLAEEVYILDPAAAGTTRADVRTQARMALSVARSAGGAGKAARALAALGRGGVNLIPAGHFSLHLTAAGRCSGGVTADLRRAGEIARSFGGREVAATILRVARATLFDDLSGVLGRDGRRWAALNAKVAHSDAPALIAAFEELVAPFAQEMAAAGVTVSRLASALGNHCFSFEPVFHWRDRWTPLHRAAAGPRHLGGLTEPAQTRQQVR